MNKILLLITLVSVLSGCSHFKEFFQSPEEKALQHENILSFLASGKVEYKNYDIAGLGVKNKEVAVFMDTYNALKQGTVANWYDYSYNPKSLLEGKNNLLVFCKKDGGKLLYAPSNFSLSQGEEITNNETISLVPFEGKPFYDYYRMTPRPYSRSKLENDFANETQSPSKTVHYQYLNANKAIGNYFCMIDNNTEPLWEVRIAYITSEYNKNWAVNADVSAIVYLEFAVHDPRSINKDN